MTHFDECEIFTIETGYEGCICDYTGHLHSAIARVRDLHNGSVSDAIYCATCDAFRPCPTIAALDGDEA